jgi:flavin reductase (DIM6/NTAB) family NADH-FMN oxidoreductase RutF
MAFAAETNPVDALKAVFRRHASGVAIITLNTENGDPVGFTATSMTSLGATPPLASFNVASGASTWAHLCKAKYVAIHTLTESNIPLAQKLAADHTKRFSDSDWNPGPYGLPIFDGVSSVLVCRIREIHSVESNAVVIVEVMEGLVGAEANPLIYHQRTYKTTTDIV